MLESNHHVTVSRVVIIESDDQGGKQQALTKDKKVKDEKSKNIQTP